MSYGHKDNCPYPGYPCTCEETKMSEFERARDKAEHDYTIQGSDFTTHAEDKFREDSFNAGANWAREYNKEALKAGHRQYNELRGTIKKLRVDLKGIAILADFTNNAKMCENVAIKALEETKEFE